MSPSRLVVFALLSAGFLAPPSSAQITAVTNDQSTPVPGAGHDYIHMLDETVNPANGSVSLRLKTPMPRGRGLSIPFAFAYDSNGAWHVTDDGAGDGGAIWLSNTSYLGSGGWSYSAPLLSLDVLSAPYFNGGGTCSFTSNFVFQDPGGGRHALGLSTATDNQGGDGSAACGVSPLTSGGDDVLKAVTTTPNNVLSPSVRIATLDGTVNDFSTSPWHSSYGTYQAALPDFIEDRNGNKITVNDLGAGAFSYTDTLGRTVLSVANNAVSISGLSSTYTLTRGTATSNYAVNSVYLNPPGNCSAPPPVSGNQSVVTAIALPDQKSYQFFYDTMYGLLNKVVYPTGGYVRYVWGINSLSDAAQYAAGCLPGSCSPPGFCNYHYDTPAVVDRYVSFDGVKEALHQHFVYSTAWAANSVYWNTKQTIVTTYDLIRGGNFQTTYTYAPASCGGPDAPNVTTMIAFQCPVEQTVVYQDWNASTLETVSKTWQDVNMLLTTQVALGTGQFSKTVYSYLSGNTIPLPTEKDEYGYGSGSPGPLLRKTITAYQSFPSTPIYTFGPSIFDHPLSTITYDGSGNRISEADYSYDQTTVTGVTNLPTGTHDEANYSASSTAPRGNATTITRKCLQTCTDATRTYTYDETGQVLTSKDPCGNAACGDMPSAPSHTTTYSYADNFDSPPSANTNAYLTQITDALGHTSKFKYAYSDGQLISSTDQNGQTTSYLYNDLLRRPTETDYPDTAKTTLAYNDTPPSPSISTNRLISSSPSVSLSSTSVMDGLGHLTQTQLTSDPDGATYADTAYDGLGRVSCTSNPYRLSNPNNLGNFGSTDGITTTVYDALGRATVVQPPDYWVTASPGGPTCPSLSSQSSPQNPTNFASTSYSGNCTTVTDQAGKSRKSCSDALGRLTHVFEDPSGLNYETDYTYDPLDNLTRVDQWGGAQGNSGDRVRTFAYDSLSQLLIATNPESGTVTYSYDANGNLASKTSPAPNQTGSATVNATFTYDALNRLTQKSFSDGTTPTIEYGYDGVALTGCTVAPPPLADSNPIGRRTAMCDGAGAESWNHDQMGRTLADERTTGGVTKTIPYTYNLDGSLYSITYRQDYYPETLSYTPGGAGRPTGAPFSDGWGLAGLVHYAPNGSMCSLYSGWGQEFEHNYTFNNRLQPIDIQDWDQTWYLYDYGSSPPPCTAIADSHEEEFHLTYSYTDASGHNNGDVQRINNDRDMERTQLFTYDSLNRLATAETLHQNQPWWQGDSPTAACWGEQFNYDPWGNLSGISPVSSAYTGCTQENWSMTPTTKNQLQDTAGDYVYDAAGNLIQPGPIGGPYVFDAENHLISAGGMAYLYDGDGKRVGKAPASTPTQPNYLYWYGMGPDILEETDGTGNYLYLDYHFNGLLLARSEGSDNWVDHFFADALGNVRAVYGDGDPDGGCSDYYPFGGERPIPGGCPSSVGGVNVPFKFTGKERDSESGLDNFGARYDSSSLGRFMSPDPGNAGAVNADPQSWNAYSYVRNSPLNLTDPNGANYLVCQTVITSNSSIGGATPATQCADLTKEQYDQYLASIQGSNTTVSASGQIQIQNDNGSFTTIGQAIYYNQQDIAAANTITQYGPPIEAAGIAEATLLFPLGLRALGASETLIGLGNIATRQTGTNSVEPPNPAASSASMDAERIANGHAYGKHNSEYGGIPRNEFKDIVEDTIRNPSDQKSLSNGRTAYWSDKNQTVVIKNPNAADGGTAFRPTGGKAYFDNLH